MRDIALSALVHYCDQLLNHESLEDYPGAVNGLQVENSGRVSRIAAANGTRAVDFLDEMVRTTFDVISEVTFSGQGSFDSDAVHRAIDAFTDQHPQVVELREALPRPLRRYAGILIDLGFDHCLARRWHDFSDVPARQFNAAVYATLSAQDTHLSPAARAMSQRLREHDLLHLYREWHTVTASAERIGERFSRGNPFADLDRELTPFKEDFERAFQAFYPELQQFATERISTLRD